MSSIILIYNVCFVFITFSLFLFSARCLCYQNECNNFNFLKEIGMQMLLFIYIFERFLLRFVFYRNMITLVFSIEQKKLIIKNM